MSQKWDHFHLIYDLNGVPGHIEGGLSPKDDAEIAAMTAGLKDGSVTLEVYNKWCVEFQQSCAAEWGMPDGATITKFTLGG